MIMNHINIALLGAVSKYLFHTLVSYSLSASANRNSAPSARNIASDIPLVDIRIGFASL